MSVTVEVVYLTNGTTCVDEYKCTHASITMAGADGPHGSVIAFTDGADSKGLVEHALYRHAEKITTRPGGQT